MDVRAQPGKQQIRKIKKPYKSAIYKAFTHLAEWTGLEPATPGVTGRYSNQLNYQSVLVAALHFLKSSAAKLGDPKGIRTPVLTVKG